MTESKQSLTREAFLEGKDKIGSAVKTTLSAVAEDAKDLAGDTRDRALDAVDATKKSVDRARDFVSDNMPERPVSTVVAVSLGVLIGLALARAMR